MKMEIVYLDPAVLVCVKPAGVLSTDEAGGLPELVRQELGEPGADLRTVHRLDRAVSGLMVLARSAEAASALSREVREGAFEKQYLAVVHGQTPESGELRDLLRRDKARKMTFVADAPGKGVQEAALRYETLRRGAGMSLVRICAEPDDCALALWSHRIGFTHPVTGERLRFAMDPPACRPWTDFEETDRQGKADFTQLSLHTM